MIITEFSIKHKIAVVALLPIMVIVGLVTYLLLPREAQPDVPIPFVIVTTPYFGVAPEDMETLVTQPLERQFKDLKGLEEFRSTSAEGITIISLKFLPQYKIDDVMPKIRDKVDKAKKDLPKDTEETLISEVSFSDFPKLLVVISGDFGMPLRSTMIHLKKMGDALKKGIESIEGVLEVKLTGGLDREIRVEAFPQWLDHYKVSLSDVVKAVGAENVNMPSGTLTVGKLNYLLRVPADFRQPWQIEDVVIKVKDGQPIRVGQVARVVDTFKDVKSKSRIDKKTSVTLSITTRAGSNLIKTIDAIKVYARKAAATFHPSTRVDFIADQSKMIRNTVRELENNIISGLVLVLLVLFLFLGVRNAFFVAISIPLSMLIAFGVISALGMTLNMVVLFALILALGMLVDNAIVIVENIYRHATDLGKDKVQASLDGTTEVAWPVIASTVTTLAAFAPLLFWPGIMGEFMKYMPLTLIITLTSSLFVALVINPVICAIFLGVKQINGDRPQTSLQDHWVLRFYRWQLRWSLKLRYPMILSVLLLFVGTMVAFGKLNSGVELFPETTPDRVFIAVEAPDGRTLALSDRVVKQIEAVVVGMKNVKKVTAEIGGGSGQQDISTSNSASEHKSRVTIDFLDAEDRVESSWKTLERIRKGVAHIAGASIRVEKQRMGPPTGAPIGVQISAESLDALKRSNEIVMRTLKQVKGLVNLRSDFSAGKPEIRIKPGRVLTAQLGLFNTGNVGRTLRAAIYGEKASNFRTYEDQYDITVRLAEPYRRSLEQLKRLRVHGDKDKQATVGLIADIKTTSGYGAIRHKDRLRVVTVSADVAGRNVNEVRKDVTRVLRATRLPKGVAFKLTGENEEQKKAQAFLSKAFAVAVFLIALILLTQFNSIAQSAIILFSVVLSLIGVLWGLVLTQTPFGIVMTGLGVISLAGIVVNNAIVMIDYINQLRTEGQELVDAVINAAAIRLRPVLLTAVTTMLGLIPMVMGWSVDFVSFPNMTIQVGGQSAEWWKPMAIAVIFGLSVATFLTLFVVPVLYYTIGRAQAFLEAFFGRHRLIRALVFTVLGLLTVGFIAMAVSIGVRVGGGA